MKLTEDDKMKMRSLKSSIEGDSEELERMVSVITKQYESDLDNHITEIKNALENRDQLTDTELEKMALKVPIYMYFAVEGLEDLGLRSDSSKMTKAETFNKLFNQADGTIQDKRAIAELQSMPHYYIEIVFSRAYKRLKSKIDVCEHLCLSIRKVIGKRTQDMFVSSQEQDSEL